MDTIRVLVLLLIALPLAVWLLRWGVTLCRAAWALLNFSGELDSFFTRWSCRIEVCTEHYPHGQEGYLPFKIYRPLGRIATPALVLYHGATPHGEQHTAMDNLARALAHIGITVFIPRLPKLKAVIIDESNLDSIAIFYRFIQGYEGVCPGRIGLVGTSFAGGLLLKAILEKDMQLPPPGIVLLIGTYCDLEATLRFIITGSAAGEGVEIAIDPDRWGQVILFFNYLEYVDRSFDREVVREVLTYYILDNTSEGDEARAKLPDKERQIIDLILTPGNPETTALADEVIQHARPLLETLSPSQFYSRIHFPFWVLHGRNDTMVPYTEALALKRLLPYQVRLHVSTLYGHKQLGTGSRFWRSLWDRVQLVTFMGRFLHALET